MSWQKWDKVPYVTKKGVQKTKVALVRTEGTTVAQFFEEFCKKLKYFTNHKNKCTFLGEQRTYLWAGCQKGELVVSIDYSEDKEHKAGFELTCEGGGAKKRAVMIPCVVKRLVDPFTDPVIKDKPETLERIREEGLQPGQDMDVLDGHMFISSLDCKKDADTLFFVVKNMVEFYRGKGIQVETVVLDCDKCMGQFGGATPTHAFKIIGRALEIDCMMVTNVAGHGKSPSDGFGGSMKVELERAETALKPLIDMTFADSEYGRALCDYGNEHLAQPSTPCWKSTRFASAALWTTGIVCHVARMSGAPRQSAPPKQMASG
ncbi:hypothetical protein CYMTET_21777 [Cymbomonas tetramitiformis]|uniref:Uncharacterized protein n=1 Tax=Cymbomonas tetramitiformis TaxID=36881 RepID=A0AAE0G2P6_9CHLO|nr:hypothetical protein CYMTET_21777 [Cymbomonas tetramitiformis]